MMALGKRPVSTSITLPALVRRHFVDMDIKGQGGFQSFCRNLQDRCKKASTLSLTPEEFERMTRYATQYGDGGFQQQLRTILANWVAQHLRQLAA
jgi:hypothetical protein